MKKMKSLFIFFILVGIICGVKSEENENECSFPNYVSYCFYIYRKFLFFCIE